MPTATVSVLATDAARRRRADALSRDPVARARLGAYYDLIGPRPTADDHDPGMRLLDEALVADPAYVPALVERGHLHLFRARGGDGLVLALADLDRAVTLAPTDAPAHAMRCRALQIGVVIADDAGDDEVARAIAECDTALTLDPRSSAVHESLARLHDFGCDDERAIDALERAIALDPPRAGGLLGHVAFLALQDDRVAVADAATLRLADFADGERLGGRVDAGAGLHLLRAGVLLRMRRTDEARAELQKEIGDATADRWREAAALRGLLSTAGAPPGAEARLQQIEGDAADPDAIWRLANGYLLTDPGAAAAWLGRLPRRSCRVDVARAIALHAAGDDAEARRVIEGCRPRRSWERACSSWVRSRLAVDR